MNRKKGKIGRNEQKTQNFAKNRQFTLMSAAYTLKLVTEITHSQFLNKTKEYSC